ncbi:MAG: hypothetical protein P4M09_19615 [Devosia sp.]|nr:hypothetical protein [Devosia sp.]
MAFFIPRTNVIESHEGFRVETLGRTGIRFVEPDRALLLDSEMLAGSAGLILYSDRIKDELTGARAVISIDDRKEIVEKIRAAFRHRGLEIEVV